MTRRSLAVIVVLLLAATLIADKLDPRLAQVRKAWIEPVDPLGDDLPVSQCVAERISKSTPIKAVDKREDADVILKVSSHLPSATSRYALAELPDGTKLWDDGGKFRRANLGNKIVTATDVAKGIECGLADDILEHLRDAMKKARDGK
jgi:hypothetical protein